MTTPVEQGEPFPREALLSLLRLARSLFDTDEARVVLLDGLGLSAADAGLYPRSSSGTMPARQPTELGLGTENAQQTLPSLIGATAPAGRLSPRRFAIALIDEVSKPARLDAAVVLARRAINVLPPERHDDWNPLVARLERLQADARRRAAAHTGAPDIGTYRQWAGFECVHHYSLTDRFIGRDAAIAQLDAWLDNDEISVQILSALGGEGKSALAWHWLNSALARLRQGGYRGAFWCSFYEKSFDFDSFLHRALRFCAQMEERDVDALGRPEIERRLLETLRQERFVLVIDGLERVMSGYMQAVDKEGEQPDHDVMTALVPDRLMSDPRSGQFVRSLAEPLASKVLITTRLTPIELETDRSGQLRRHVGSIALRGLARREAAELWSSIVPAAIEPEIEAIFEVCGYHPLTISILARSIAASGGDWRAWRRAHRGFALSAPFARARMHIVDVCMGDLTDAGHEALDVLTTSGKPMTWKELSAVLRYGSIASGDDRWIDDDRIRNELGRLVALGFVGETIVNGELEFDVHPVVRGVVWRAMLDPQRERFLDLALSEFGPVPDPQRPLALPELHKAVARFKLLVKTGQVDRAWEMLHYKLALPMQLAGAHRELLELFELLLDREPLQLLPLASRREQADALDLLGDLLFRAGENQLAETLLSWSAAIRVRIDDPVGSLANRNNRAWHNLYKGRLFEIELELRRTRMRAMETDSHEVVAMIDSWLGLVFALRGARDQANGFFRRAEAEMDFRAYIQTVAEGFVYLDAPDDALDTLRQVTEDDEDADPGQRAWESLTRGMARFAKGRFEAAEADLGAALDEARRMGHAIIQCFALSPLAEIRLEQGDTEGAADLVEQYFQRDPKSEYRIAATDAWRVRARCAVAAGDPERALDCAAESYRLAACDGPPFSYVAAMTRARALLASLGAYVPRTEMRLDPDWKQRLRQVRDDELHASPSLAPAIDEAPSLALLEGQLLAEASEADEQWWILVVGRNPALTWPLTELLHDLELDIAGLRGEFERSDHKSLEVLFYELDAARVIRPHEPRPVGTLTEEEQERWLLAVDEHDEALTTFLQTSRAKAIADPFEDEIDERGTRAFLADGKRRIGLETAAPEAKRWWTQLQERRPPRDMLIVAEAILAADATVDRFVRAISTTGASGLEYAFRALAGERARERQTTGLSATEGWTPLQVQLRLQTVKYQLGWVRDSAAREFWTRLEHSNEHQLRSVLKLAEDLALRGSSLAAYHNAYLRANTEHIQAALCYLDYLRLAGQPWRGGHWPSDISVERWSYDTATPTFTDTSSWTSEQVARRLRLVESRIGLSEASPAARQWWQSLTSAQGQRSMVRLAEELDARETKVFDLFGAHVDGGTDNVIAALAYLDYQHLRERREVDKRAPILNARGSSYYSDAELQNAIECFEAAIEADPGEAAYYRNAANAWHDLAEDPSEGTRRALEVLRRGIARAADTAALESRARQLAQWLNVFGRRGGGRSPQAIRANPIGVEVPDHLDDQADALIRAAGILRESVVAEFGIRLPRILFRSGSGGDVDPTYVIELDDVPVARGAVPADGVYVVVDVGEEADDLPVRDPLFGRPGRWMRAESADAGLSPSEFVMRHLRAVALENLGRFVTEQAVQAMLEESWAELDPIGEPDVLSGFTAALRGLAAERVPLVDIDAMLDEFRGVRERGGDVDDAIRTLRSLDEVRSRLPGSQPGTIHIHLGEDVERQLRAGLHRCGDEHVVALASDAVARVLASVRAGVQAKDGVCGEKVLVVADERLRRYLALLIRPLHGFLPVVAESELADPHPAVVVGSAHRAT